MVLEIHMIFGGQNPLKRAIILQHGRRGGRGDQRTWGCLKNGTLGSNWIY